MRKVCAWCKVVMEEGTGPITHSICQVCVIEIEGNLEGDEQLARFADGSPAVLLGRPVILTEEVPEGEIELRPWDEEQDA